MQDCVLGCYGPLQDREASVAKTSKKGTSAPGPLKFEQLDARARQKADGLALGQFRAHIPAMSTIVQCNCGAKYRRTEEKFLVPHTGDAICTVCGAALESWRESTHVPSYELIERPDRSRND